MHLYVLIMPPNVDKQKVSRHRSSQKPSFIDDFFYVYGSILGPLWIEKKKRRGTFPPKTSEILPLILEIF